MRNTRPAYLFRGNGVPKSVCEGSGSGSRENKHFAPPRRVHLEIPPSNRCADNDLPDIGGSLLSCLPATQTLRPPPALSARPHTLSSSGTIAGDATAGRTGDRRTA